jgi:hypothetical protein
MPLALAALRILGGLGLGFVLGVSALRVVGEIPPDAAGMLVPIIVYGVIGGGSILAVASPQFGVPLLLGWAAPWLLVLLVVADDGFVPYLPFPASITALYVLALGLAFYRRGHRR